MFLRCDKDDMFLCFLFVFHKKICLVKILKIASLSTTNLSNPESIIMQIYVISKVELIHRRCLLLHCL